MIPATKQKLEFTREEFMKLAKFSHDEFMQAILRGEVTVVGAAVLERVRWLMEDLKDRIEVELHRLRISNAGAAVSVHVDQKVCVGLRRMSEALPWFEEYVLERTERSKQGSSEILRQVVSAYELQIFGTKEEVHKMNI